MSRILTFLFAILATRTVLARLRPVEEPSTSTRNLVRCASKVARNYFDTSFRHIMILSNKPGSLVEDFEDYPMILLDPWVPRFVELYNNKTKFVVVLLAGDEERDSTMLRDLRLFHDSGYFVVILPADSDAEKGRFVKIFEDAASTEKRHVALLFRSRYGSTVDIYRYSYHQYGKCNQLTILKLGECDPASDAPIDFEVYPNDNFNHCPARMSASSWPPYWKFEVVNGTKVESGLYADMMQWFAEKLNASAEYHERSSPDDVRRAVSKGDADIGYGPLAEYLEDGISFTHTYMFGEARIILPPAHLSPLIFYIMPLNKKVWLSLIIVIPIVLIAGLIVPHFRRHFATVQMISTFLGISSTIRPKRYSQRTYYIVWIFFGFAMGQLYLANLTGSITNSPVHPEINTLQEFDRSDNEVGGLIEVRDLFKECCPRIYREFKVFNMKQFLVNLEALTSGTGGIPCVASISQVLNTKSQFRHVTYINEKLSWSSISLIASSYSVISLNQVLDGMIEGGYITFWIKSHEKLITRVTEKSSLNLTNKEHFTLRRMQGAFWFHLSGTLLCLLVFAVELAVARRRSSSSPHRGGLPDSA